MTGLVVGIDVGTSGVRAVAMDASFAIHGQAGVALADFGTDWRDPATWWRAIEAALTALFARVDAGQVRALAVDGTSGTMLPVDRAGEPLSGALMYSDKVEDAAILSAIAAEAPPESAAHGATSGLAKLLLFQSRLRPARVLHQADWIAGRLTRRFAVSDENNALKTGYDPVRRRWPDWIGRTGADMALLPQVVPPGTAIAAISAESAKRFGLAGDAVVVAGTTDGCASFLATGAARVGDAVTALGSSLTLKALCETPLFAPQFGIYSHRIGDAWLAGGASNTGGKVLAHFFPVERIVELSGSIKPDRPTGLDYYPLIGPGERFPIADAGLAPRLEPRPADDALFLQAMLEGIAAIEARGYRQLADLGGPELRSVRSVGGGARNPAWTAIRGKKLGVPFLDALCEEAAAGTARLALQGARQAGLL
ncbi:carbohydrate kinase [Mesorhizobium sp. M3A.F.Ca.ET.174.01.1.1]|uniref:FGGY-family carbohydrate kinase n=1 Tax=unclassified Mesorhizobium TaxID=325217 RepID=UPI001093E53B|nr:MULTISPECIES: FGGY-family carbohydrate kinase [unclassified Mesorhizobium]TGS65853.1 carbohydrate kinase [Mesorhizobium sp. M3A.F.Ca.ET.201.01.1.1]TGS82183.1 carbohydrate kinase [Mesorhizobium sp. M3A.F.Ca.ET.175.01.1.1]TGT21990.1 carbohydrate kinase [Mesorhizobium sp. M3A.F.Ca.ET.174.01.1.1]